MMEPPFDTDFEYDEWYEKKREEQMLEQFGDLKQRRREDG